MLCAKFGWNWPSGSGEEHFWISSIYFCYFVINSHCKRTRVNIWTNLNSPLPRMNVSCQVWLKLHQQFWRRSRKCDKFTDGQTIGWTDRQTDVRRKVIGKVDLSFQLRRAKNYTSHEVVHMIVSLTKKLKKKYFNL